MSLDTQTKRRSMIAIPGIGTLPVADSLIDVVDRRHFVDVFAAFPSITDTFFFWRKQSFSSKSWVGEVKPATTFVPERVVGSNWVPDQDHEEQ